MANYATAVGDNSKAASAGATVIGASTEVDTKSKQSLAAGSGASVKTSEFGIAIGRSAKVDNADRGIAIGHDSSSSSAYGVSLGDTAKTAGGRSTALGNNSSALSQYATAVGNQAAVDDQSTGGVATGSSASVTKSESGLALGRSARVTSASQAVAIGRSARTTIAHSVALGSNAVGVANNNRDGAIALSNTGGITLDYNNKANEVEGAVSVGQNATHRRQIKNVADGSLGSDAVTVRQLAGVAGQANKQFAGAGKSTAAAIGGGSAYNPETGEISAPSINVGGNLFNNLTEAIEQAQQNGGGSNKYVHVASTDADNITTGINAVGIGSGGTVAGSNSIGIGTNASTGATASGAVAIGNLATTDVADSVALGSGSAGLANNNTDGNVALETAGGISLGYNNQGNQTTGAISVGADDTHRRQIKNIADGSADSDASTVGQLASVASQANKQFAAAGKSTAVAIGGGSEYNPETGEISAPSIVSAGGTVTNVTDGIENNAKAITQNQQNITNIQNGKGVKYLHVASEEADNVTTGTNAVGIGSNGTVAGGNSIGIGTNASTGAAATGAVAIGHQATTDIADSVAIGSGSTGLANTNENGTVNLETAGGISLGYNNQGNQTVGAVSVGADADHKRQIKNVADGSDDSDASTVGQLASVASQANKQFAAAGKSTAAAIGGGSEYNPETGEISAPSIVSAGGTVNNLTDGIENNAKAITQNQQNITNIQNGKGIKYLHVASEEADNVTTGINAVGIGAGGAVTGDNSIGIGTNASTSATATGAVAIGNQATTNVADSVALGSGSAGLSNINENGTVNLETAGGISLGYNNQGNQTVGAVSVGADASHLRQIRNVADGSADTDVVTVRQLAGVAGQANRQFAAAGKSTAAAIGGGSAYNPETGEISAPSINVGGNVFNNLTEAIEQARQNGGGSNKYVHVASTDADNITTGINAVGIGSGGTVAGSNSIGIGTNASTGATASGAVAIGNLATTDIADSVALGSGSVGLANSNNNGNVALETVGGISLGYNNQGNQTSGAVSVGADADHKRQIKNVADGSDDSDASTVGQLASVASQANKQFAAAGNSTAAAIGGGSKYNPETGEISAPFIVSAGGTVNNLTDGIENNAKAITQNQQSITNIQNGKGIKYLHVASEEADNITTGINAVGIGSGGTIAGGNSIGIGTNASTGSTATGAVAIGHLATTDIADSVALGSGSTGLANINENGTVNLETAGGISLGYNNQGNQTGGAVSVGADGDHLRQIKNVADGSADSDASTVGQLASVASQANKQFAAAGKSTAAAIGGGSEYNPETGEISAPSIVSAGGTVTNVTDGVENNAKAITQNQQNITNIQNGKGIKYLHVASEEADNITSGTNAVGIGSGGTVAGSNSIGIGTNASTGATATGAVAIGHLATTDIADSVAVGSGSAGLANNNTNGNVALETAGGISLGYNNQGNQTTGAVSVGADDTHRRQIKNIADGSADSDASTVGQLASVASQANKQFAAAGKSTAAAIGGGSEYNPETGEISAPSIVSAGGTVNNLTDGIENNAKAITQNQQNITNIQNGQGIKYFHVASERADNATTGTNAIGIGANGAIAGTESIGIGSDANTGADAEGSIAIGQAANVSVANAVALRARSAVTAAGSLALGSDSVASRGSESYTGPYSNAANVTAGTVSVGRVGGERNISNVADGRLDTDAVNLRQLAGAVTLANQYTDRKLAGIDLNGNGNGNGNGDGNGENPDTAIVIGPDNRTDNGNGNNGNNNSNSKTFITGGDTNNPAINPDNPAIGRESSASASGSGAFGAGSTDEGRENVISFGSAEQQRQLTNVADGVAPTDAVNRRQLDNIRREADAGIATAIAIGSLGQPTLPDHNVVSFGAGYHRGQNAFALGISRVTADNRWILKGAISSSSRGNTSIGASANYQWK